MFLLKKFVTAVVLPPTSLLLLAGVGLILAARRRTRRAGFLLASASLAGLLALSTPFVAGHLTRLTGSPELLEPGALVAPDGLHANALGVWFLLDKLDHYLEAKLPGTPEDALVFVRPTL